MARKNRWKFNIDYLKLCLNTPSNFFEELTQQIDGAPIFYDCFFLFITDNGRGRDNDKEPLQIIADLFLDEEEEGKNFRLGTFTFFNSNKYEGRSFFTFENKAFYKTSNFGRSYISYLDYIIEKMGLTINNITQLDIACDVNFNANKTILNLIKDYNNTEMIYKGKVVEVDEEIEDFGEYFTRKRNKRSKFPTLYFQHKKGDGLSLRAYNKSKEIEENQAKQYIEKWNGFGKANTHRVEITIKNEEWKKFIASLVRDEEATPEELECLTSYCLSTIETHLAQAFDYTTQKLLYFRCNGRKVTLLDIITGNA